MKLKNLTPLAVGIVLASFAGAVQAEDVTSKLRINGFASAGASWVSEDFGGKYQADIRYPSSGIDEAGSLSNNNVLGIQVTYELSDKFDLVGQLVSAGQEDYDTRVEWAYVTYKATDKLRLRAGRFAAPLYMYSETLRVGQSYPWAHTPTELYATSTSFSSLDGLDLLYRQPIGSWSLDAQVAVGGSNIQKFDGKAKQWGSLNLALSNGTFTVRGGYSQSLVDLHFDRDASGNSIEQLATLYEQFGVDMDLKEEEATFADVGATYDDGNWFAAAEFGRMRVNGHVNDLDAGYLSVGHYFGKWLPYVMYSKINIVNADECSAQLAPAVPNANALVAQLQGAQAAAQNALNNATSATEATLATLALQQVTSQLTTLQGVAAQLPFISAATCGGTEQTSYSAGFRYDATRNVSVKFEVDHVRDFNGTPGFFNTVPGPDESTNVFTFNVNATF